MKPKEKAEQLVNSFYYALPNNGSSKGLNSTTARYKEATVCALIAVDEILDSRPVITDSQVDYQLYWRQVKNEIIGGDK
jgi:hypothetical protein